jgi:hypothetical protein
MRVAGVKRPKDSAEGDLSTMPATLAPTLSLGPQLAMVPPFFAPWAVKKPGEASAEWPPKKGTNKKARHAELELKQHQQKQLLDTPLCVGDGRDRVTVRRERNRIQAKSCRIRRKRVIEDMRILNQTIQVSLTCFSYFSNPLFAHDFFFHFVLQAENTALRQFLGNRLKGEEFDRLLAELRDAELPLAPHQEGGGSEEEEDNDDDGDADDDETSQAVRCRQGTLKGAGSVGGRNGGGSGGSALDAATEANVAAEEIVKHLRAASQANVLSRIFNLRTSSTEAPPSSETQTDPTTARGHNTTSTQNLDVPERVGTRSCARGAGAHLCLPPVPFTEI